MRVMTHLTPDREELGAEICDSRGFCLGGRREESAKGGYNALTVWGFCERLLWQCRIRSIHDSIKSVDSNYLR